MLVYTPVRNENGFKSQQNNNLTIRQNMTTDEFKVHLQESRPDVYAALEYFNQKYPQTVSTPEDRDRINNTRLCSRYSLSPKTCKTIWQRIERWFLNKKRPPRTSGQDIQDWIDQFNQSSNTSRGESV